MLSDSKLHSSDGVLEHFHKLFTLQSIFICWLSMSSMLKESEVGKWDHFELSFLLYICRLQPLFSDRIGIGVVSDDKQNPELKQL